MDVDDQPEENLPPKKETHPVDRRGTISFSLVDHWGEMCDKEVSRFGRIMIDKLTEKLINFTKEVLQQVSEEGIVTSEIVVFQQSVDIYFGKNQLLISLIVYVTYSASIKNFELQSIF